MKTFPKEITRKAFVEWLWSKPLDGAVGTSGDSDYCPLANFIYEKTGDRVSVCADSIWKWELWKNEYATTPPWFRDFVMRVDEHDPHGQVSAETALRVLGELKGEAE